MVVVVTVDSAGVLSTNLVHSATQTRYTSPTAVDMALAAVRLWAFLFWEVLVVVRWYPHNTRDLQEQRDDPHAAKRHRSLLKAHV
jgi:hypothetical protein